MNKRTWGIDPVTNKLVVKDPDTYGTYYSFEVESLGGIAYLSNPDSFYHEHRVHFVESELPTLEVVLQIIENAESAKVAAIKKLVNGLADQNAEGFVEAGE